MHFHRHLIARADRDAQHHSALADRLRRILQQIRQHALHQVLVGENSRTIGCQSSAVDHLGMRGPQKRDALFEQGINIDRFGRYRRLG